MIYLRLIMASVVAYLPCSLYAADTQLLSHTPTGVPGNSSSQSNDVSDDGNRVAFESTATNLVNGLTLTSTNVFTIDRNTNQVSVISLKNNGTQSNLWSVRPNISGNGEFVAFTNYSSDLTNDLLTYGIGSVFLKNLSNNGLRLVSRTFNGTAPNGLSDLASLSRDGSYVVYHSLANNIVPNDTNGKRDIFLFDTTTNSNERISISAQGVESNADSVSPKISRDGEWIIFSSVATNLSSNIPNSSYYNIHLYNRKVKSTVIVSKNNSNVAGNGNSIYADISADGRFVAYVSNATNILPGVTDGKQHVYLYDRINDQTTLVDKNAAGEIGNNTSASFVRISGNGRHVVFTSSASNLVANDTNATGDLFSYDRVTDKIEIVSLTASGQQLNNNVQGFFGTSYNGQNIAFASAATNLDSNGYLDVYMRVRNPIPNILPVAVANGNQSLACSGSVTNVSLNGENSYDLDGSITNYKWTSSFGTLYGSNVTVGLAPGVYPVTLTVTDDQNGQANTSFSINVYDNLSPVVSTQGDVVREAVNVDGAPFQAQYSVNDNCSNTSVLISPTPANYPVGKTTVTVSATDTSNNVGSASFDITVRDTIKPTLSIPADLDVEATSALTPVAIGDAQASDIFPVTLQNNALPSYPIGTHYVQWTATDANNNQTSKVQTIRVADTIAPVLSIPADIVVEAKSVLTVVDVGTATATDAFDVTITNDGKASYGLGTHFVTWTATDANGNAVSAVQTIRIEDTQPPVVDAGDDKTIEATSRQGAPFNPPLNISDACGCGPIQVTVSPDLEFYPLGTTAIEISAKDVSNNIGSDTMNLTVADTTAPTLNVPNDIVDEAMALQNVIEIGQATAHDIFDVTVENNAPAYFALGTKDVTWTATDSNGNSSSAIQRVTIKDTKAPVIDAVTAQQYEATARLTPIALERPGVSDVYPVTVTSNAPAAFALGTTLVEWRATDTSNNISTTTQAITIVDTTKPVIYAPGDVVAEASNTLTSVQIGSATATDIFNVVVSNNAPASFRLGDTQVTWTATDENNNVSTAVQTVTIVDTKPPVISIGGNQLLEATSSAGAAYSLPLSISDACNCGPISYDISPKLSVYPLGTTRITVTARDVSNNTASVSVDITVVDTTAPVINAPADITVTAQGMLTTVNIGQATATDLFAVTVGSDAPSAFPVGTTVVTWTAVDANGNRATSKQTVTVQMGFAGFQDPVRNGGVYKFGRVLPVKIKLLYANGAPIENAAPALMVFQTSNNAVAADALDINSTSAADNGTTLRYVGNGEYMYNLDTNRMTVGTYRLAVDLKDGTAPRMIDIATK